MNILYIGDIMAQPGIDVVRRVLPDLRQERAIDLVIAQAENVSAGKGMLPEDMKTLQEFGVDFFTGGNWSLAQTEVLGPGSPVVRPANYPDGTSGVGYKRFVHGTYSVLVISLLGKIVGKDADRPVDNPLRTADAILQREAEGADAIVVNFHGDYSSEKRVIGYYLDGRVTAVIGDHWHVPTADAMILPKGTAHITDVGMCGSLHSSLGVKLETIIARWRDDAHNANELDLDPSIAQFSALLIETDTNGLAAKVEQILRIERLK